MIRLDARTVRTALGKKKEYMVTEVFNYKVHYFNTGIAREHFALSIPSTEGAVLLKGASSSVFTGNVNTRLAKTINQSGFTIQDGVCRAYKGTLIYNAVLTKPVNVAGNSVNATISSLKIALETRGFKLVTEWDEFDPFP